LRDRSRDKGSKKRGIAEAHLTDAPAGTPATPAERGFESCPCPKEKCELRAECLLCAAYHGRKSQLPRCER
jgi:hypothetical protein